MKFRSRLLPALLLIAQSVQATHAALVISEFIAANDGGLRDADGDSPDWIEIHNDSTDTIDLQGWHLTDDPGSLAKWTFPATRLAGGGYLVVFASGKSRAATGAELHTNFQLDQQGQYLALVEPDAITVASAFSPAFPAQHANISFGLERQLAITPLIAPGAAARVLVPTDDALGVDWTRPGFEDSTWAQATTGIGFDAPNAGGNSTAEGRVVLSLDFNDDDSGETGAANTPAGFTSMTLGANPATFGGITVSLSALGSGLLDDRDRDTPVAAPPALTQDQLYDDFIFVLGENNGDGVRIQITGLSPNQDYALRLWSFDSGSPGARSSDWIETAGGTAKVITNGYTFDGALPPTSDNRNTIAGRVRASAAGTLVIEGRRSGGTSHGVFLNALQLVQPGFGSLIASDLGSSMSNRNASAYARIPFCIDNADGLASATDPTTLRLRMRYNDGFAAYLNGRLIASRSAPDPLLWNSAATTARAAGDALVDEDFDLGAPPGALINGTNVLSIHGLNISAEDGDFLVLPELQVVTTHDRPGRYFASPTPGAGNGPGYEGVVADTRFSVDRGFFETPFTVAITTATAGAEIRWTTDGSAPGPGHGTVYAEPVLVTNTTLLRAAAFKPGFVPSDADTHTYLFLGSVVRQPASLPGHPTIWQAGYPADYGMDSNVVSHPKYGTTIREDLRSLPTLSLVTEHEGLWNAATGIYPNATSSGDAWERAASAELIRPDGTTAFAANCGLRMQGNASRDNVRTPKHSLRLLFKGSYGPTKLRHDWFGGAVREFDNIVLRACFTDSWATRYSGINPLGERYRPEDALYLRDVWMKDSFAAMGHLAGRSTHVHLYLNGLYWGLYNPCERQDASFFAHHLGGPPEAWDVIRDFSEVLAGTKTAWSEMMRVVNAGITTETAYQNVRALVDVDNLIDYMLLHIYAEAEDWPHHNWYAARRHATNGLPDTKWIFLPWDQEIVCDQDHVRNQIDVSNDDTPARIYSQLRAWPEFRREFGDHVQRLLCNGGALSPAANIARMQARAASVHRAMVAESARWGDARKVAIGDNPGTGQTFTRDEWWTPELEKLCAVWFPRQHVTAIDRFRAGGLYPRVGPPEFSQFGGAVPAGYSLAISHTNATGTVFFTTDGSDPRTYGTGAVAPGAQAYPQPILINSAAHIRARVLIGTNWSAIVEGRFFPPQNLASLRVTEIMYNPPAIGALSSEDQEFLELKNTGSATLDLTGLAFTAGIQFAFTNETRLEPGSFFLLARNPAPFAARVPAVVVNGIYTGRLDNGGELLRLSHPLAGPVLEVAYGDQAPWPLAADGAGFSLVPTRPNDSVPLSDPARWRASANPGGSPGADDPELVPPAILVNEVLNHSTTGSDFVELFNPTSEPVDLDGWFLTDDPGTPKKFRLPAGTTIPPSGYLVLTENDFNADPGAPDSFAFNARGDDVYLFSGNAQTNLTGYSHGFGFGPAADGRSFGRHVISTGEERFAAQIEPTPGTANRGPLVGPIVFTEIQYHPENAEDEFVEMQNISPGTIRLFDPLLPTNTWRVNGLGFSFPTNLALAPGQRLLLVNSDVAAFRERHHVAEDVPVLGPLAGALQDSGERLELQRPIAFESGGPAYLTVEEVRYNDRAPWPPAADGAGPSLQRKNPLAYADDPANWEAATPTPGTAFAGGALPFILSQPRSATVMVAESVSFTVDAAGPGLLGYQWLFNGDPIPGATSPSLSVPNPQAASVGGYSVIVFNQAGSAVSTVARLTVIQPPFLLNPPADQYVVPGADASFSVIAIGTGLLRYQWEADGVTLPGATNATLTIRNAQADSARSYAVRVTDNLGSIRSSPALLQLVIDPVFIDHPISQAVLPGAVVVLSASVTNAATLPVGFRWRRNGATLSVGAVTVGFTSFLFITNADPLLVNYSVVVTNRARPTGLLSKTAVLRIVTDSDGDGMPDEWERAFDLDPANAADAREDADGDRMSNGLEYLAGTNPREPASVLSGVRVALAGPGQPARLAFMASSNKTYSVEWKESIEQPRWSKLRDLPAGTTNREAILLDPFPPSDRRVYRLVTPRQPDGPPGPLLLGSPRSLVVNPGEPVRFEVSAAGLNPLKYSWAHNGTPIPDATGPQLLIASASLGDLGLYAVRVTDLNGTTTNQLPASLLVRPQIITAPLDQQVAPGGEAIFGVTATGLEPLRYQWLHDGVVLKGATNATWRKPNVQPEDEGTYQVRVSHDAPPGRAGLLGPAATLKVK